MARGSRCVSTVATIIAIIVFAALPTYAQEFPAFRFLPPTPDQPIDFNSFLRGDWLRNLGLGRTAVGIFYGGGSLRGTHTIEAGPNHVAALSRVASISIISRIREKLRSKMAMLRWHWLWVLKVSSHPVPLSN